jgi:hypothetical protein
MAIKIICHLKYSHKIICKHIQIFNCHSLPTPPQFTQLDENKNNKITKIPQKPPTAVDRKLLLPSGGGGRLWSAKELIGG